MKKPSAIKPRGYRGNTVVIPASDKIRLDKIKDTCSAEPSAPAKDEFKLVPLRDPVIKEENPVPHLPAAVASKTSVESKKEPTDLQRIMRAYKVAKGMEPDDAGWDKHNYAQYVKAAKKLLDAFGGDSKAAIVYLLTKGEEWDEDGLEGWTLHAIAKHAWDFRGKIIQNQIVGGGNGEIDSAGRGPDQRLGSGTSEPLGDSSLAGPGRTRRITQAREVAGEVLKTLMPEQSGPRQRDDRNSGGETSS